MDCLEAAAKNSGLEMREQTQFDWYSGKADCDFALSLPNKKAEDTNTYDIGVVKDNGGGYSLQFDFYRQEALRTAAGNNCSKLMQQYSLETMRKAAGSRFRINSSVNENGDIVGQAIQLH